MAPDATTDLDGPRRGRVRDRLSLHQKQVVWAWTFLAVPIVFYVVIRFWPTLEAFWLSFTIAYHLDRVRFMHGFIRALYFLPFLTTAAAMAWVWRWFYQPVPIGLINDVLSSLGLPQQPFLRSTTQALPAVLAPAIWANLGFQVVIFMAGLRAIPTTYYEAARIDGVSNWTILTRITLPLLKPTVVFLVVFSSIGFLRIFDQVYNMKTK